MKKKTNIETFKVHVPLGATATVLTFSLAVYSKKKGGFDNPQVFLGIKKCCEIYFFAPAALT